MVLEDEEEKKKKRLSFSDIVNSVNSRNNIVTDDSYNSNSYSNNDKERVLFKDIVNSVNSRGKTEIDKSDEEDKIKEEQNTLKTEETQKEKKELYPEKVEIYNDVKKQEMKKIGNALQERQKAKEISNQSEKEQEQNQVSTQSNTINNISIVPIGKGIIPRYKLITNDKEIEFSPNDSNVDVINGKLYIDGKFITDNFETNSYNTPKFGLVVNPKSTVNEYEASKVEQNEYVKKEAQRINELVDEGKYVEAFTTTITQSIGGGMGQSLGGLMNLMLVAGAFMTKGFETINKIVGNTEEEERLKSKYNNIVAEGSWIHNGSNISSNINSLIENDFISTSGKVTQTISQQIWDKFISMGYGGDLISSNSIIDGALIQGLEVAGGSAQEVLDKNPNHILQAAITGGVKGYLAKKIEELFDANILTRGFNKSSIEKQMTKIISKTFKTKIGKEIANKAVGIAGENVEEFLEDNLDMLLDALMQNEELPNFEQWWNNTTETAKITTLSTFVMQLMGLRWR